MASNMLRNTHQRQIIFDTVTESFDHPTADLIYKRVQLKEPTISIGTVYRNLNLLSELGDILHLSMPFGPDRYDFNTSEHCHFICRKCGSVRDVDPEESRIPKKDQIVIPGYTIDECHMVLSGFCPLCKENNNTEENKNV